MASRAHGSRRARGVSRAVAGLVSVLLAAGAGGCSRSEAPTAIVLLSVDTLRADALRAYAAEAPALPAIDDFARQATLFTRAVAPSSWTLPSQASLLTGLYPDRHGGTDQNVALLDDVPTLARALAAQGWQTVAFTDGGFLGAEFGYDRGFHRYDDRVEGDPSGPELPRQGRSPEIPGSGLFERARAWLAAREADAPPLFLFLQTYAVHEYHKLHPWILAAAPSDRPDRPSAEYARCLLGGLECSPADWERLRALYRSGLKRVDAAFAALVSELRSRELWDRAIVVLVSDHGEGFEPERRRTHHGGRLHEDVLRVPLLVRVPGEAVRSIVQPVSLVDVAPTLLELVGIEPPPGLDGVSFAPALRGGPLPPARPLFAMEHDFAWVEGRRHFARGELPRPHSMAVIDGSRWYIRTPGGEELYDLAEDPQQRRELTAQGESPRSQRAVADARERDRPRTRRLDPDSAMQQRLRSLGYLQ